MMGLGQDVFLEGEHLGIKDAECGSLGLYWKTTAPLVRQVESNFFMI